MEILLMSTCCKRDRRHRRDMGAEQSTPPPACGALLDAYVRCMEELERGARSVRARGCPPRNPCTAPAGRS